MPDASPVSRRDVIRKITSVRTSDGAGVTLRRSIGSHELPELDPFLLLDNFGTDKPEEYIAGFPDHPHRGFETVTYMLKGLMRHRDNTGAEGKLRPGSIQWMTAGRGIVHSEMPEQTEGEMSGFQLWVNLPAKDKMCAPRYQDIDPELVPVVETETGATVRVLAGAVGDVAGPVAGVAAEPVYLDVSLDAGGHFRQPVPDGHTAFVFVFEGAVAVDGAGGTETVATQELAVLGDGDTIAVTSEKGGRCIVVAGKPFHEPVARYGPFVMNTREEIMQAIDDFQAGRF
ncbi:MAG: pirin family protein [Rhodospirillales bacterium]